MTRRELLTSGPLVTLGQAVTNRPLDARVIGEGRLLRWAIAALDCDEVQWFRATLFDTTQRLGLFSAWPLAARSWYAITWDELEGYDCHSLAFIKANNAHAFRVQPDNLTARLYCELVRQAEEWIAEQEKSE